MHYQEVIKKQVRNLRLKGNSLGEIHQKTKIAKSTISLWTKDIVLSDKQQMELKNKNQKALQNGRIEAQKIKKELKMEKIEKLLSEGKGQVNKLSKREIFLIGIALYWAEGFKNSHEHRLGFCNSDPIMIKFYIKWLKESIKIPEEHLILRVTLNSSYKERTKEIAHYWSQLTKIPLSQFTIPFYQNSQWKKQYKDENYHGVLRIHVKDSVDLLTKMKGWIEGIKQHA